MPKTISIDAAELGPRHAKPGERMRSIYTSGYTKLYEFIDGRWVQIATFDPRAYPTCWTLADGTRQADHP